MVNSGYNNLVGGFNPSEKYEFVNGKDYPIYYGKIKMFQTTNQITKIGSIRFICLQTTCYKDMSISTNPVDDVDAIDDAMLSWLAISPGPGKLSRRRSFSFFRWIAKLGIKPHEAENLVVVIETNSDKLGQQHVLADKCSKQCQSNSGLQFRPPWPLSEGQMGFSTRTSTSSMPSLVAQITFPAMPSGRSNQVCHRPRPFVVGVHAICAKGVPQKKGEKR